MPCVAHASWTPRPPDESLKSEHNMGKKKKQASKQKKPKWTAKTADRHVLYQLSVQDADYEVEFLTGVYKRLYKEKAYSLREDFCGTAYLSSAWVKSNKKRTASGVDICADTLAWGRTHNVEPLGGAMERVTLFEQDVRDECPGKFQIINALNFSYWVMRTREDLLDYFRSARRGLADKGMFICDAYGGWEAQEPMLEPRKVSAGFTYVWDQDSFDPITHEVRNHIHFEFSDGTRIDKAFTYEWRMWTLPEITELLREAGFSEVTVLWDQADVGEDEKYRPSTFAENQPGWLAYIVGLP